MFKYWAELNFTNTVSTFEDVANQPIWLNSNIKCHKKLLYSDSLISKKLIYVSDILNSDLKLLTLDQFNDKFALQWNEINFDKIILALPLEWRRLIDSNTTKTFRKSQNLLSITKSVKMRATKFFYAKFIDKNITLLYNAINKWNRDLGTNDTEMKWQAICEQIYTIIPVKLRSFYFKFIHRALPCNYTLYKMCIVETEYCRHCYNVPKHLCICFGTVLMPKNYGTLSGNTYPLVQIKNLK